MGDAAAGESLMNQEMSIKKRRVASNNNTLRLRKRKSLSTEMVRNDVRNNVVLSYDVTLDPTYPLGFYCVTSKNKKACVIVSICPVGQTRKDHRIQIGTCIRSVTIGEVSYPIKGHAKLKSLYSMAQCEKKKFMLKFVNSALNDPLNVMYPSNASHTEWTSNNEWQGEYSNGWAGGAAIFQLPSPSSG